MDYTYSYLDYARWHHEELLERAKQERLGKVAAECRPRSAPKLRLALADALIALGTRLKEPWASQQAYLIPSSSLHDSR